MDASDKLVYLDNHTRKYIWLANLRSHLISSLVRRLMFYCPIIQLFINIFINYIIIITSYFVFIHM
jgi:hypothetical protein